MFVVLNHKYKNKSTLIVTYVNILRLYIMKFIIQEEDIPDLIGKFIVQLNNEDANKDFTKNESNAGFMLEKRIHFVAQVDKGVLLAGFFYSNKVKSKKDFVTHFNQEGGDRFHRLLTTRELKWLSSKIIERNF